MTAIGNFHQVNDATLQKGMTQAISHFSRFEDAVVCPNEDGKYDYRGTKRRNALDKLRIFYRMSILILVLTALLLFIVTAHSGGSCSSV
jgi:hypothetical protein